MRIKVVVVGEADVGKTCIVTRASKKYFNESEKTTVGAANSLLEVCVEGKTVILNIWDTAGQEKYRSLTQMYFNGASLAIVVFDLTNKASFDVISEFISLLKERAGNKIKFAIVGNKSDLPNREISFETAENFTMSIGGSFYMETSAKTGDNINDLFQKLAILTLSTDQEEKRNEKPMMEEKLVLNKKENDFEEKQECC